MDVEAVAAAHRRLQALADGVPFTGRGHKTFQFVRTPGGWRISSVSWHDQ
jgi:hypothetical protein